MARRHGFTLIELLVVVAITSLVLGSLAVSITTMLRYQRQVDLERHDQQLLARLQLQLGVDCHRALEARLTDESNSLQLIMDQATEIRYESGSDRMDRVTMIDGQPARRETYSFSVLDGVDWELNNRLVRLRLERQAGRKRTATVTAVSPTLEAGVGLLAGTEDTP